MLRNLFLTIGLLFLVGSAHAQSVPNSKIIVVDFDRVSRESLVGKDIAAQTQSFRVDLEGRARAVQQELSTEEEELAKQRSIISQDAFNERVRAFQQKAQQRQAELQQIDRQSGQAMQQANLEVQRSLRPIVREIMEAKGANMVLDKALVSHHASGLDVTTEVIEKLDETMPSFDVSLPKTGSATSN
ncbi:hypothetical protein JCM17844_04690 [Iodidimonas gelatinilytica]|uniref:OmpH family outer membrane protein n=1 Tax=Iodidimonas gelatinilytica TaxID=1236966 RepID=A0A5A7MYW5_9PROT|nr:OmpH family outer membrane protein [Iodidimonas gelatinilytica]GEQ96832.1 hypothetical protein JCM17844_04690 [Iodidimonas gelatinilytica]GER01173.1 hypothetical protein JCM17845_17960 [Iodidimonas gelatinilytica]